MRAWFSILFCLFTLGLSAQDFWGMRFATDINYFARAVDYDLVPGAFTTGKFGLFYNRFNRTSAFEIGLNLNYKNQMDTRGFPNIPVIMEDYGDDPMQRTGLFSLEMDFKVGPKLDPFFPKIGYILGYRFNQAGFTAPGLDLPQNQWYLMLPFGLSVNLPTNFGAVGFGASYNVGVLNVLQDPGTGTTGIYDGGRQRSITVEITVGLQRTP